MKKMINIHNLDITLQGRESDIAYVERRLFELENRLLDEPLILNISPDKIVLIKKEDIKYIEVYKNDVSIHTITSTLQFNTPLKSIEVQLPQFFIRVSKSAIVNIHYVQSFTQDVYGAIYAKIRGSIEKIYVSRRCFSVIKKILKEKKYGNL